MIEVMIVRLVSRFWILIFSFWFVDFRFLFFDFAVDFSFWKT